MKNMLTLTISLCFLSTMVCASDAQTHHIVLDSKAKERLIRHMITHTASDYPESDCRRIREKLNNVANIYVSVECIYSGTKYEGYWVELTTDSIGWSFGHLYNKKKFSAAIGEPTESCCC